MHRPPSPPASIARLVAEAALVVFGCALVAGAIAANQQWLDRHFLPSWFLPRAWYVVIQTVARLAVAAFGIVLAVVVRPRLGRVVGRWPGRAVHVTIAGVLALGASELVLDRYHLRAAGWLVADEEPRRRPDSRLGWTPEPSREGHSRIGGRAIAYAFDAHGYRVRRAGEAVDFEQPAIVFTGESVMFGEGLTWEESVPAQVGMMLGVQTANLAVHGFGNDQAYLRLQRELPRFRRPIAVVSLFMPALFGRNLDDDRPHLGPGLVWQPAADRGRLARLAGLIVPYRRDETVERGILVTRDVLRATVDLARARSATPLILVPQFGVASAAEQTLRQRIVVEAGVPWVEVEIDSAWRLPWDRHPNAYAARVIAEAIAARLSDTAARSRPRPTSTTEGTEVTEKNSKGAQGATRERR
jgi:hypothetical protein